MQKTSSKNFEAIENYLIFHRIISGEEVKEFTDVDSETFCRIAKIINQTAHGHNIAESNIAVNQPYRVACTFDDGNESDYHIAFPVLINLKVSGYVFVVSNWVGRSKILNKHQIIEMSNAGINVGSHSADHVDLCSLSRDKVRQSLYKSRCHIEDLIGKEVELLSFPFGSYNLEIIEIAKDVGYRKIFCSDHGIGKMTNGLFARNSINYKTKIDQIPKLLFPTSTQIARWKFEDRFKARIKSTFGLKGYRIIRKIVYG
jgi:peptidoglycan/xylan/chitin deacetylase (PgdA/CDA1 family)